MSDSEDADLELLRQAALSSLLKKKSAPLQTNAVFYRPVSNSNLISIQPITEIDERNDRSDAESSSGSEYAVIEEGLSVSSFDVDQVIEEIIESSGESDNGGQSEDEAEDAVSIASHDSFDEILNSVEEELRSGSIATKRNADVNKDSPRTESKRARPIRASTEQKKASGRRSPKDRGYRESDKDSYSTSGNRRPVSPTTSSYMRKRRSNSPVRNNRRHSPIDHLRRSKSPTENRKPSNGGRRRVSPFSSRRRLVVNRGHDRRSSDRRIRSRSRSKSAGGSSDKSKSSNHEEQRRPPAFNNNNRRHRSPDRSRSPRNRLSFGDHRLRTRIQDSSRPSSRNSSRHQSRDRSRSPRGKRKERSKSIDKNPEPKIRSPSPDIDSSNLTEEERARLERRKLKFKSSVSNSGKVILKPQENRNSDSDHNGRKDPKSTSVKEKRHPSSSAAAKSKPKITSRLGPIRAEEKSNVHERLSARPSSKSSRLQDDRLEEEDLSNTDSRELSAGSQPKDQPKEVGKDDLRTKLQQKRAANVGRLFTAALKDTLHKDSAAQRSSTSPRS